MAVAPSRESAGSIPYGVAIAVGSGITLFGHYV
jgi:Flp pilus assembly protein protease CpaA